MSGLHKPVQLALDCRAGIATFFGLGNGTWNHKRGFRAAWAWTVARLAAQGAISSADIDAFADLLGAQYMRERREGLCGGEALDGYSVQHLIGGALQISAVHAIAQVHPSPQVQNLWDELVCWWRGINTVILDLRGADGVIHPNGPRVKGGGPANRNVRGSDLYAEWRLPASHPYIRERMSQPLSHTWWATNNEHEGLLRRLLWEEDEGRLIAQVLGPRVQPRTAYPIHYLRDTNGLRHTISEWLSGNGDSDGRNDDLDAGDGYWRFDREAGTYTRVTIGRIGGESIPKGYNARWEVELAANGRVEAEVYLPRVQGVRGEDRPPHPTRSAAMIATLVSGGGWLHFGPDTPIVEPVRVEIPGAASGLPESEPKPGPGEPDPDPDSDDPHHPSTPPTQEQVNRARRIIRDAKLRTKSDMTGRGALLVRQSLQDALALLAGREPGSQ